MPNFRDMFDSAKEKLGVGRRPGTEDDYDYDDEYEDYDELEDFDEEFDEYDDYDDYDDYDRGRRTRSSRYSERDSRSSRSRSSHGPALVSFDEARRVSHSDRGRDAGRSSSRGRTMVDSSLPPAMTPEGSAAVSAAASRRRESGLDSLFGNVEDDRGTGTSEFGEARGSISGSASAGSGSALPVIGAAASESAFDTYRNSGTSAFSSRRRLTVIEPATYADVEGVANALKAGDAVVLALGRTPGDLSKRILDFSFGVASALDAKVEGVADKVFAITRGDGLTDTERANLHTQGTI